MCRHILFPRLAPLAQKCEDILPNLLANLVIHLQHYSCAGLVENCLDRDSLE